MKIIKCAICGAEVVGTRGPAKFCPTCRVVQKKLKDRASLNGIKKILKEAHACAGPENGRGAERGSLAARDVGWMPYLGSCHVEWRGRPCAGGKSARTRKCLD